MTRTANSTPVAPAAQRPPADLLRLVLRLNAATSLAAGMVAAIAAAWWANVLGIESAGAVRVVGLGLVAFAIGTIIVAGLPIRSLRTGTYAISAVDLAWVVATLAVLASADLTGLGQVVAVVLGVGVLGFAALQIWFSRHSA